MQGPSPLKIILNSSNDYFSSYFRTRSRTINHNRDSPGSLFIVGIFCNTPQLSKTFLKDHRIFLKNLILIINLKVKLVSLLWITSFDKVSFFVFNRIRK